MASIQSKGKQQYIVYDDPRIKKGEKRRQIWEQIEEGKDVEVALAEFNLKKLKGKVIIRSNESLEDFILRWAEVYAPNNWGHKTYSTNMGLIKKHIVGEIGHMEVRAVKPYTIETLIQRLKKKKVEDCRSYNKEEKDIPALASSTVRKLFGFLEKIFEKAVEWKCIEESPVTCKKPEAANKKRQAWSKKSIQSALKNMEENKMLHLMVHNAFICSLRNGENMGITLDCIDLEHNSITINKTIQRVDLEALEKIPQDELIYIFPSKTPKAKSVLVLKDPKTESSVRTLYMTEQLKEEIIKRLKEIEKNKEEYGERYVQYKYDMLFCLPDGSAIEPGLSEKWFKRWQRKTGLDLPELDFHGIRHSSVAYKYRLSGGDFATVKGDSGHATMHMVNHYADHTFDEDRIALSKSVETEFYEENRGTNNQEEEVNHLLEQLTHIAKSDMKYNQKIQETLFALVEERIPG